MGRRLWGASVLLGFAPCVACGGRAQSDVGAGSGGNGSLFSDAGYTTDPFAGNTSTSSAAGAPPGCTLPGAQCPTPVNLELDLTKETDDADSGVSAEPIQAPEYGLRPPGDYPPSVNTDPTTWDRSALPAGACVFRLRGWPADCMEPATIINGSCVNDFISNPTAGVSYYELGMCQKGVAPGCPTADPWNASGNWWYLLPDPDGVNADLILCAPACAATLALYGSVCFAVTPG
jgi:hypothetical protein